MQLKNIVLAGVAAAVMAGYVPAASAHSSIAGVQIAAREVDTERHGRGHDDPPGDDRGHHTEPGDDRGHHTEPGDDRGRGGHGHDDPPGDDHGHHGHGHDDGAGHT